MAKKMAMVDWRAMKYYQIRGLLLPAMVVLVGITASPLLVMPTSVLLAMFFAMNPFAVEEKGALNNLYLTLPVDRRAIVRGRYLLACIMGLCGLALSVPIMILANTIGPSHYHMPIGWYVFILALSYFLFAFFLLATFPVLFKLGYNKGKFWGLVLPAGFMGLLYGGFTMLTRWPGNEGLLFDALEFAYNNMLTVSGGLALVATLVLMGTVALSQRIYAKREF